MTDIGSSLTYTLPSSELPNFDNLFAALDKNLTNLRISGFGVSDSTLDEVIDAHESGTWQQVIIT